MNLLLGIGIPSDLHLAIWFLIIAITIISLSAVVAKLLDRLDRVIEKPKHHKFKTALDSIKKFIQKVLDKIANLCYNETTNKKE